MVRLMFSARLRFLFFVLLSFFALISVYTKTVNAALSAIDAKVVSDSEEDFSRRIYSYDMAVDSQGTLHIIYSKPLGDRTAQIFYVRRIGGVWQSPILLSSNGFRASVSTFLLVGNDDRVHVCYIKDMGTSESLFYRSISNGNPASEICVGDGGWHSRMQLGANGFPVFVRDNEEWQIHKSRLALLTTQNGSAWSKSFIDLPDASAFVVADFLFENGVYHITYGDSAYTKPVLNGTGSTTYIDGVFSNLHYATSQDGQNWEHHIIDSSGTLYKYEFWPALILDGGCPLVSMYKYAEYANTYNTGTSALLAKWNGAAWEKKSITNSTYPDSREGMGVGLVVNRAGDYFGAWDFSPDNTHDDNFRGARGNIALARNGSDDNWLQKVQIAPFSLEGAAKLRIRDGKLYFLALGDYVDAKLYFYEYKLSDIDREMPLSSSSTVTLPFVYLLLKH